MECMWMYGWKRGCGVFKMEKSGFNSGHGFEAAYEHELALQDLGGEIMLRRLCCAHERVADGAFCRDVCLCEMFCVRLRASKTE